MYVHTITENFSHYCKPLQKSVLNPHTHDIWLIRFTNEHLSQMLILSSHMKYGCFYPRCLLFQSFGLFLHHLKTQAISITFLTSKNKKPEICLITQFPRPFIFIHLSSVQPSPHESSVARRHHLFFNVFYKLRWPFFLL